MAAKYNAPQMYTDLDGLSRSFTYVDHDIKGKFTMNKTSEFNKEYDILEKKALAHPEITEKYFKENNIDWSNVNLGHLRLICKII